MRKTRKKLNPLLFAILTSLTSLLVLSLIAAFVLLQSENPSGNIGIITVMLFPASGAISAVLTTLFKGENAVKEELMASFGTSLLIIALGLIFSKGALSSGVLINAAVFILSSLTVSYLSRPKRRRHRR